MNQLSSLLNGQGSDIYNGGEGPAQLIKIETKPSSQTNIKYAHLDQTTALLSKYIAEADTSSQLQRIDSSEMKKISEKIEQRKKQVKENQDEDFDIGPIIKRKVDSDVAVNLKSTSSSSISNQPSQNSISSKPPSQTLASGQQNLAQQKVNKLDEKVSQKNAINSQRDQTQNQQVKKVQNGSSEKPKIGSSSSQSNFKNPQQSTKSTPSSSSQASIKTQQSQNPQNKQSISSQRAPSAPQKSSLSSSQSQQKPLQGKPNTQAVQKQSQVPGQRQGLAPSQQQRPTSAVANKSNPQQKAPQTQQKRPTNGQQQQPNGTQQRPVQARNGQQVASKPNLQKQAPSATATAQKPGQNNQKSQKLLEFSQKPPEQKILILQQKKQQLEKIANKTSVQIQQIQKINTYIQQQKAIIQQRQNKSMKAAAGQNKQGQQQNKSSGQKPQQGNKNPYGDIKNVIRRIQDLKQKQPMTPQIKEELRKLVNIFQEYKKKVQQKQQSKLTQEQKQKELQKRKMIEQRKRELQMANARRKQRQIEDDYDSDDGFVVKDDDEELSEDLKKEYERIIRKDRIKQLAKQNDKNKIDESNIYQIKKEELQSDRIARSEDAKEQQLIKKEKIEQKKRRGLAIDSDEVDIDEDDDDDDEEEEEEEEEEGSYDSFIVEDDEDVE